MKKHTKTCFALLLTMLLLAGCSNPANDISTPTTDTSYVENSGTLSTPDNHELIVPIVEECRVSSKRTGTYRQGIDALGNGFEVTDTGSYWMCDGWLLYSDHGSDTIIKLCGRPDCPHSGNDCNAFFYGACNICYYDGYLYTFESQGLYRVNLDGSDRLLVFDLPAFKASLQEKYRGTFAPEIRNGTFTFALKKVNGSGHTITTNFYYKLDGSMEAPEMAEARTWMTNVDGDAFCGIIEYDAEEGLDTYGLWNPDTNTTTSFFQSSKPYYTGYIGSEAIYYIENGMIYEYAYATDATTALFDTGLDTGPLGNFRLYCFPNVIVVSEFSDDYLDDVTLRFYDWNFQDLGSIHIDFPFSGALLGVICGETHERFMLTDNVDFTPRYYIEKSDLGTGNITIHEYEWDFEWD